jgi:hypothetical protein
VDPVLDQTSDLPLAAPPADSPVSPQEPAPPVDPVTDQTPPLPLRRSDRVRAPPAHLRDYSCFSAVLSLHEPHTYREACTNPLWQQAMTEELQALEKTHTWDLVDLPRGKSAIGCKWVYKIKTKSDGTIERYKARLVAKGYAQEYGIDYEETFAPVARITSVRSLLAIAAVHQWPLFQMDVKNVFLNGDLTEEVYMQAPPGYSDYPNKVCLLRRALYGLKQAPRAWFAKFSNTVHQFGFSSSPHDTTLFIRRSDKGMILLLLYVDDMIITRDDHSGISDFKQFLHQQFEMKDLGHLGYFLGLEVSSDSTGYYLSQAKYASDLLSRAGLTDTKVVSTPLEMNARLTPLDGTPLSDATLYRQLVGSLVYLTVTRPDIAHAVHLVSQFLAAPHSTHYAAVIHILRYIKGTMFHGLHFSAHSTLDLCAYSDADWAGILLTAALLLAFVSFWGTLLFPGTVRNNILCLALALRQSTVLWLILPLNFSLFAGCWKIWVLHILHRLSYIVTIVVLFRLRIMMFSMNAPSILRLIVILCVIICLLASCVFFQLAHLIRLLTSLRRLFLLVVFVILFPNSRWLLSNHLEFEGDVRHMYIYIYRCYYTSLGFPMYLLYRTLV